MKALSFKSFLFSLVVVMNCAFVSAQEENNFIYDTKYENDMMVSKTVFERDEDTNGLNPKTMYEYKYDQLGRIAEKIAYRWDSKQDKWVNNFKLVCVYNEANNTVEIDYAKWDNKTKKFDLNTQQQTYSLEAAQSLLAKK